MPQPTKQKRHVVYDQVTRRNDPYTLLDSWLALDRRVVELSMRRYGVPRRDRFMIRAQQRRLHDALREFHERSKAQPATDGLASHRACAA
jgi:hypothetical protein